MPVRYSGFTLIEMILALALTAVLTMLAFYEKQADLEQQRARQVGGLIFQYNNAVRNALALGMFTNNTSLSGADWLKSTDCGGSLAPGKEFLPCEFPSASSVDPIAFGKLSFMTNVVLTESGGKKLYKATTTSSPFTVVSGAGTGTIRSDLAGIAALSAAAALTAGYQSGAEGLTPYTATTDASYKSSPTSGRITFVASNSADNDVWLRTDGGNNMHASLQFDAEDSDEREISGVSSIQNFAGEVLKIGSGSGLTSTSGAGVVIDSSAEILGDFRVRRTLYVDDSLNVTGNITATGVVHAGTGVESDGAVTAQGNVTAKAEIAAGGDVTAGGTLIGQAFYDANNKSYFVDPHSASNLNGLSVQTVTSAGRVKASEFMELGGIATIGTGCAPNGLIGRSTIGEILSCKSGIWASGGGGTLGAAVVGGAVSYHDSSKGGTAYCPEGSVLVGLINTMSDDSYHLQCRWLD